MKTGWWLDIRVVRAINDGSDGSRTGNDGGVEWILQKYGYL